MTTQEAPSLALALAETLAERLCHDLAGMVGTLMGAVELATDDPSMRDEALPMASEAAVMLGHRLRLMRAAWGSVGFSMDGRDLVALAAGLPSGRRVRVVLDGVQPGRRFTASTARLLLNLLILAVEALGGEGTVSLSGGQEGSLALSIDGPRAAWPSSLADQIADPAMALQASTSCQPRQLQAPLTALIAQSGQDRILLLPGAGRHDAALLMIEFAETVAA